MLEDVRNQGHCVPCGRNVQVVKPPLSGRLLFWGAASALSMILCAAPFFGWFLFFSSPLLILMGMALGPIAEKAFAKPLCSDCGREVVPDHAVPALPPVRAQSHLA